MQTNSEDGGLQYRAVFDAEVTFSNGGALQAQRFRVDLPSAVATAEEIGELLVRSLDLLMRWTERSRLPHAQTLIAQGH
jgi:hypothetical protein